MPEMPVPAAELADMDNQLSGKSVEELMRMDPKFITRAILGLDGMMAQMNQKCINTQAQISADTGELAMLDKQIADFERKLDNLNKSLTNNQARRQQLDQDLKQSTHTITSTVRETENVMAKARSMARRLASKSATDKLSTSRGYTTTISTREYIAAPAKNIGRTGLLATQKQLAATGGGKGVAAE